MFWEVSIGLGAIVAWAIITVVIQNNYEPPQEVANTVEVMAITNKTTYVTELRKIDSTLCSELKELLSDNYIISCINFGDIK